MENMVDVYLFGKKYSVPDDLTIMRAMEYAGYQLIRGCGCRNGFCGACATIYRIKGDRELLDSTNYPIESIALSCGYSDALVFTKAFHAMKGMSPSKYRKESHKESTKEQLQEVEGLIARLLKP